jgi:general secretion pathway protein D
MRPRLLIALILCLSILAGSASRAQAPAPPAPAAPPAGQRTVGAIDFQGTPVQAVLEYYAQNLAKRSIISLPNMPGTIWFRSQTDLTVDEARQALDTVLAINGIAVMPFGEKFLKVVQIPTAKQEGVPFMGEGQSRPTADTLMTQVIPLKYAEATDVVGALQPFLHAYGQITPLPKSSCILICETAANVNQMLEIVKVIDVPSALKMETKVIVLKNAKAADVVQRLQSIIQETQQAGGRPTAAPTQPPQPVPRVPIVRPGQPAPSTPGAAESESVVEGKVVLTSDERTNKIFILSRASNFPFFERIIAELDAKVEPDVLVKVISLEYATAEDIASLLNALISGGTPTYTTRRTTSGTSTTPGRTTGTIPPPPPTAATSAGAGAAETGLLEFSQGVRILPDPRMNTLVVMATKEDMKRIEGLIKSVDAPVAQVQIEVIIAEVTLNNELDVGVTVFKRLFDTGQISQTGGTGTDGNAPVELPRASDVASGLLTNPISAAAIGGATGGLTYFTTFQNLKLDAVIHALASTSKGKVLSTPVIQTMDNQEANILVGESVPVPVSQVSSLVSGTGTLATGQLNSNIEYKDAAIELKVTPRINPDGYVRMEIEQKVNDFGASVQLSGVNVPTITKREAKSIVAVQNESTIVLGGLIKENKTITETKVPFLGDIPLFGQLFKSKANGKIRNELIIFIRPTVMRNDREARAVAMARSRMLKAGEELELEKHFEKSRFDVGPLPPESPVPPATPEQMVPPEMPEPTEPAPGASNEGAEHHEAPVETPHEPAPAESQ